MAGQVTAILGPNGAGKSTLMSVLTGQRQPVSGQVYLAGQTLAGYALGELARLRACVAQETQVAFEFTVREVVELGRYPHSRQPSAHEADIAQQAMQATAVEHLQHRALNTLSGGEKARVHLARVGAGVGTGDVACGQVSVRSAGPPQASTAPEGLEPAAPSLLEQVWTGDRGEASGEPRPARPRELYASERTWGCALAAAGRTDRRAGLAAPAPHAATGAPLGQ
ncbi:ATP-binding cassette domain-containing protein [Polaromonas sp. P2-4]|nr:ATP-binding cassette domain-containing protein [Polaromonas sp. P2-4]